MTLPGDNKPGIAGYRDLEVRLGYHFKEGRLLRAALTHPSYAHENPSDSDGHNQRLEFLGDAVLGLIIGTLLYHRFENIQEGKLSRLKAELVCEETLAQVADNLQLGRSLLLGRGEQAGGGAEKRSILSDLFEAVLGAIYLDGGYEAARVFVEEQFSPLVEQAGKGSLQPNNKAELQERSQSMGLAVPEYSVTRESGPPHMKTFYVEVSIGDRILGRGQGRSKKEAEKKAAEEALNALRDHLEFDRD